MFEKKKKKKAEKEAKEKWNDELKALISSLQSICDKMNAKEVWKECQESERAYAKEKPEHYVYEEGLWDNVYKYRTPGSMAKIHEKTVYQCKWTQKSCCSVSSYHCSTEGCQRCKIPFIYSKVDVK